MRLANGAIGSHTKRINHQSQIIFHSSLLPQAHRQEVRVNFKYAVRSLVKNPLVTTIAVLSLAVGIGGSTAIFSLIDRLLLRMLPVERPEALVQLAARGPYYGGQWGDDR